MCIPENFRFGFRLTIVEILNIWRRIKFYAEWASFSSKKFHFYTTLASHRENHVRVCNNKCLIHNGRFLNSKTTYSDSMNHCFKKINWARNFCYKDQNDSTYLIIYLLDCVGLNHIQDRDIRS